MKHGGLRLPFLFENAMNQEKIKLTYNISTWEKLGVNFWGIPKVGNTSIKYLLHYKSGNPMQPDDDKNQWVHHIKNTSYITPEQAESNGYKNVAVIRNPYDRFMSMWKDVKRRRRLFGIKNCDIIEDLVKILEETKDKKRNIHFRSQCYFLKIDNIECIDIHNTERLQSFFEMEIPHKNSIKDDVYMSDEIGERVYEIFKDDFIKLGYSK